MPDDLRFSPPDGSGPPEPVTAAGAGWSQGPWPAGVRWSVCVRDGAGRVLLAHRPDDVLPVASVGKLLLLAEVARRLEDGSLHPARPLRRDRVEAVADSGLWQHLAADALTVEDLARLVGAVSDNLATNVLLDLVGLEPVRDLGRRFGLVSTGLHDRVRDVRGPEHPPVLATGTAAELSGLLTALAEGRPLGPAAGRRVLGWLALNTDLSMVASAFGLDPLAHNGSDLGLRLADKTGSDAGVRAEVGVLSSDAGRVSYAAVAHWPADLGPQDERAVRFAVLAGMRRLGEQLPPLLRERPAG